MKGKTSPWFVKKNQTTIKETLFIKNLYKLKFSKLKFHDVVQTRDVIS